jgi:hypothetical protein
MNQWANGAATFVSPDERLHEPLPLTLTADQATGVSPLPPSAS